MTTVREAAEWFAQIQAEQDLPPETLQAWLRWMESSAENRKAFESIARIWHGTNAAVLAQPRDAAQNEDYDDSVSVKQWRAARRQVSSARSSRRRRLYQLAAAASVLVCVGVVGFYGLNSRLAHTGVSSGHFATHTGEHLELTLADGSQVTLGGQTKLDVQFTDNTREVRLASGEAFFSLRKDPTRPFKVLALDGVITAVGTAFNVRAIEDRVTVTVTEGAVKVADDARTPEVATDAVRRGQEVVYRSPQSPTPPALSKQRMAIEQVDPADSVRWRSGWLMYHDEPLSYVIADISRYTSLKLQVSGAAAELRFSGAIYKDRISEWVVSLPEVSPLTVEKEADYLRIESRVEPRAGR